MSSPKRDILSNDIIVIVIMIMIVIKIMIPCLAGTDGRLVDKCVTEQTNDARGKWSNVLLGEMQSTGERKIRIRKWINHR